MAGLLKGFKYDKKTGKKVRIDMKASRAAKKGAKKRRGKKLPAAVRMQIAKSLRRVTKTGRTGSGRKAK